MTEIVIVVWIGIVMHRVYPQGIQVYAEQTIACRTQQQVVFILLEHIGHTNGTFIRKLDPLKLIVSTIIIADTSSASCP